MKELYISRHVFISGLIVAVLLSSGCVEQPKADRNYSIANLSGKVSKSILGGNIPSWARNPDGTANFTVIFIEGTTFEEAVEIIRKHGGYYMENFEGIHITSANWYNGLIVTIDENEILCLASEPEIRWVNEISPEPVIYSNIEPAQKIHEYILKHLNSSQDEVPPYIINEDGTWNIIVNCDREKDIEQCREIIAKYATSFYKFGMFSFQVKIPKENIYELARESIVTFIEEGNVPIAIEI